MHANMNSVMFLLTVAAVLGGKAFIFIRYPARIKNCCDNAPFFEAERRFNRTIAASTYQGIGWVMAIFSLILLSFAIGSLFHH